jgi:heme exporter protein B
MTPETVRSTMPDGFRAPGLLRGAWLVARKDLRIELRTRSAILAAMVFAVLAVVVFRFTWDPTAIPAIDLAPGVLWVIFTFSGLLGLNRSFGIELQDRAYDALLASTLSRESIFAGKALANLVFVMIVQALTLPAVALFFDLPVGASWLAVAGVVFLASIGLSAVGTLFAAIAANTRLAELLLPMMTLPFFVPLVIPAAQTTAQLMAGRGLGGSGMAWLKLLLAFDLVFVFACVVMYPFTVED